MKTVDIKGKPYVEVSERLKYFRENFKGYSLQSEILSNENGLCIFRAWVCNDSGAIVACGHAYEKEGDSFINKTSYIENCETSAWGRALANFGIGIDASVASADEVFNAVNNQPVELNRSAFGKPDDNELMEALSLTLETAVNDGLIDSGKASETLESAKAYHGQGLSNFIKSVDTKLNTLRG